MGGGDRKWSLSTFMGRMMESIQMVNNRVPPPMVGQGLALFKDPPSLIDNAFDGC